MNSDGKVSLKETLDFINFITLKSKEKSPESYIAIKNAIQQEFGFEVPVITLTTEELKKIIDSVSAAAGEKSIVIELKTNSPQIIIALDFLRTRQIFWNLLMNAIKFTPAQGRIYVNLMKNSDEVQVSIQDTGKGIAPEFLPFIFERFSQEDMSYSREKGGLGIGLSLARDLILLQGGKINAESLGINKGATFTVLFPINELILT